MKKIKVLWLAIAFILPFVFLFPSLALVTRSDECELGQKLGLPVYEWRDESVDDKAIIVAFHGMTFYGLAFNDMATYLASQGYPVYAFDFRGFGRWLNESEKYPSDGKAHFGASLEDAQKLIEALQKNYPNKKIFCIGESLGSNLILSLCSHQPQLVDGAILSGLGVKRILHFKLISIIDVIASLFNPNRPVDLKPYIKPYLASDPSVAYTYMHDPQIHRQLSSVELIKAAVTNRRSIKDIQQIPSDMPILIIAGEKDLIYKTKALPAFVQKLGSRCTTLSIIPDKGHLLLEIQPVNLAITGTIDPWLDKETKINAASISRSHSFREKTECAALAPSD
jgi:alpha-beta hydrolase superfamily lysophospholipase